MEGDDSEACTRSASDLKFASEQYPSRRQTLAPFLNSRLNSRGQIQKARILSVNVDMIMSKLKTWRSPNVFQVLFTAPTLAGSEIIKTFQNENKLRTKLTTISSLAPVFFFP